MIAADPVDLNSRCSSSSIIGAGQWSVDAECASDWGAKSVDRGSSPWLFVRAWCVASWVEALGYPYFAWLGYKEGSPAWTGPSLDPVELSRRVKHSPGSFPAWTPARSRTLNTPTIHHFLGLASTCYFLG